MKIVRPSVDSKADMYSATGTAMPGLTRYPVLSMAESERTEGEKEIVVSLVRQWSWTHSLAGLMAERMFLLGSRGAKNPHPGPLPEGEGTRTEGLSAGGGG